LAEKFGFEILSCKESTVLRKHDEKDVLGALIVLSLPPSKLFERDFSLCSNLVKHTL
jgi:hypothetical protein